MTVIYKNLCNNLCTVYLYIIIVYIILYKKRLCTSNSISKEPDRKIIERYWYLFSKCFLASCKHVI